MIDPVTKQWVPDPVPAPGPVATAPMAPFQVVAPPEESNRTEVVGPSTTTVKPTAEATQAQADMKAAQDQQSAAAAQKAEADQAKLKAEAEQAEKTAAEVERQARAREAIQAQNAEQVKQLQAVADQKRKEMEAASHPTSYWEDRGKPAEVIGKFLTVLGGGAGAIAGTGNVTYDAFKSAQDQDRQNKIRLYTESKEFHALARQDVAAARASLADQLKQFDDQAIVQANVFAKHLDAISKRMGLPVAAAEAAGFKAKIDAENAEKRAKEQEHYSTQVQSGHTTKSHTVNVNTPGSQQKPPGQLDVLDKDGNVIGQARSPKEAEEARAARTELGKAYKIADQLKGHIDAHGNLLPLSSNQGDRDLMISQLVEARKQITGAETESDSKRYKKQLDTAFNRGPDATKQAVEQFVNGLDVGYAERVKSVKLGASEAAPPAAAAKPATTATPAKRKAIETKEVNGKRYVRRGEDWFAL